MAVLEKKTLHGVKGGHMNKVFFCLTISVIFIISIGTAYAGQYPVPPVDPDDFISPRDNTYFPMSAIGKTYVYEAETEEELVRSEVTFTTDTVDILGAALLYMMSRNYTTECKKSGAQVLFIWAYSPETSIMMRQWADMEVPALPIGFIGAAEDPGFWEATKGKGAYTIVTLSETGCTPSNVTPLTMKYYNAFKKRWNVAPRSTGCVSAYEALYVLKDAIERAGTVEDEPLIGALEKTNLPAVRGTIRFDQNHQIIYGYDPKTSVLGNWVQWQNGERVTIFPQAAAMGTIKMPPWLKK